MFEESMVVEDYNCFLVEVDVAYVWMFQDNGDLRQNLNLYQFCHNYNIVDLL